MIYVRMISRFISTNFNYKIIVFQIVGSWLNLDLNFIIAVPLFVYGRYAIGEDDGVSKSKVTHIGAGIGYRFNKYARMIAFIESNNHESKSSDDPKNTIWLKSEAKF